MIVTVYVGYYIHFSVYELWHGYANEDCTFLPSARASISGMHHNRVYFSETRQSCTLASTKLYYIVLQACGCEQLVQSPLRKAEARIAVVQYVHLSYNML